jgi:hypothetical protein
MRLGVGLGAFEAREKRVMDVDRAAVQAAAGLIRQYLHVAGKDHEFGLGFVDEAKQAGFLGRLGGRSDRQPVVRNAVAVGDDLHIRVIRNDAGYVHFQLAGAMAIQQIFETMIELRHQDHDAAAVGAVVDRPLHLFDIGDRDEILT